MRAPLEVRLMAKLEIDAATGCWNFGGSKRYNGYGQIMLARKNLYPHRVSYEVHVGEIPDGLHVCHHCDNRACINPEHLFLGTAADNMADRNAKGRQARGPDMVKNRRSMRGVANGNVKLTELDVFAIRASALSIRELAAQYGMGRTQIIRVLRGESWKFLPGADSKSHRVPETNKTEIAYEHDRTDHRP